MLYVQGVGLTWDVAYPLKPPSSQATRLHPGKAKSYEPKAPNKTISTPLCKNVKKWKPTQSKSKQK